MIKRGTIARCSQGTLGLITCDEPQEIDGQNVWIGIHLTDEVAPVGSPWSSKEPEALSHIKQYFVARSADDMEKTSRNRKKIKNKFWKETERMGAISTYWPQYKRIY